LSQEDIEKRRLLFKKRPRGSKKKNSSFKRASFSNQNEVDVEQDDNEEEEEEEKIMFYTGEDLSQKQNGRILMKGGGDNNTLASLNERKFQTRKSEQELQGFFYQNNNSDYQTTLKADSPHKPKKNGIVAGLDLRSGAEVKEVLGPVRRSDAIINSKVKVENLSIDLRRLESNEDYDEPVGLRQSGDPNAADLDDMSRRRTTSSVRGFKSVNNPDVVKFQEQSEWLDKLVTEEVKAQKIRKEKGTLYMDIFIE